VSDKFISVASVSHGAIQTSEYFDTFRIFKVDTRLFIIGFVDGGWVRMFIEETK